MKKTTKVGIVFIVLSVFVIGIGSIFAIIINNYKTMEENKKIIRATFNDFSLKLLDNYTVRDEIGNKLLTFDNETYETDHESYVTSLTKYNQNITELNTAISIMEDKCTYDYKGDVEVKIFCNNYQQLYEIAINIYVSRLNTYNEKIKTYNETSEKDYELFTMINKEQIDYNKNGIFEDK